MSDVMARRTSWKIVRGRRSQYGSLSVARGSSSSPSLDVVPVLIARASLGHHGHHGHVGEREELMTSCLALDQQACSGSRVWHLSTCEIHGFTELVVTEMEKVLELAGQCPCRSSPVETVPHYPQR